MWINDRLFTINQIVNAIRISRAIFQNSLHNYYWWVQRLHTPDQNASGWSQHQKHLTLFKADLAAFLNFFPNPRWVFQPASMRQSMPCKYLLKRNQSYFMCRECYGISFLGWKDISCLLLQKGHTIDYVNIAMVVRKDYQELSPKKIDENCLFSPGLSSSTHISLVLMVSASNCGFKLMNHPRYSPHFAHVTIMCLPIWKKYLTWNQYCKDDDTIPDVADLFDQKDEIFTSGI